MCLKSSVTMLQYHPSSYNAVTKPKLKQTNKQKPYSDICQKRNVRVGSHLLGHELCFYFLKLFVVDKCILIALRLIVPPPPTPQSFFSLNNKLPFQFIFKSFHYQLPFPLFLHIEQMQGKKTGPDPIQKPYPWPLPSAQFPPFHSKKK